MLAPLYSLLHKKTVWKWDTAQQAAFSKAKKLLVSSPVLVHFDQAKPLVLSCDASPYGIGAVLFRKLADGSEHPVAFTSRSLSPALPTRQGGPSYPFWSEKIPPMLTWTEVHYLF